MLTFSWIKSTWKSVSGYLKLLVLVKTSLLIFKLILIIFFLSVLLKRSTPNRIFDFSSYFVQQKLGSCSKLFTVFFPVPETQSFSALNVFWGEKEAQVLCAAVGMPVLCNAMTIVSSSYSPIFLIFNSIFVEEQLDRFGNQTGVWRTCLYAFTNTDNQYVRMYCLQVFEVCVNTLFCDLKLNSF